VLIFSEERRIASGDAKINRILRHYCKEQGQGLPGLGLMRCPRPCLPHASALGLAWAFMLTLSGTEAEHSYLTCARHAAV
jgi:hypothetical protein